MINYEGTVELRIENGEWRICGLRNKLPVTSDWSSVISCRNYSVKGEMANNVRRYIWKGGPLSLVTVHCQLSTVNCSQG